MDVENEAKDREIERLAAELQGKPDDLNLSANEVTQLANMLERKKASKIALKQELEDKEAELKQERDAGMAKDQENSAELAGKDDEINELQLLLKDLRK